MPSPHILTISRDLIQILSQLTYLDDLRGGCEVCVAAYLCGFVAPGPVCGGSRVVVHQRVWSESRQSAVVHNQKTEPYPLAASEEIDRSVGPMISRRSSKLDR